MRLREADNIAAMAELQQQISELEIQVSIVFLVEIATQSLPLRPSRFSHTVADLKEPWSIMYTNTAYLHWF